MKALPLQELDDVNAIKTEIGGGNILIVRITPLAKKSVDETKLAITELTDHVKSIGGDIARLGEERIVITPPGVRIWRREMAGSEAGIAAIPLQNETLPGTS
ncbi:cell division protein SepF [Candidatus Bathyarchaeota archaeon]|nr:cell division protein SepF [Candidatus Bathyarchaeota archaeon]